MIDKKGFVKLFDLNVPTIDHFDYYIDQLSKSVKFRNIKNLIPLYEEAEEKIGNLYDFRIEKSKEVIDFIKDSNAWIELCLDKTLVDYPSSKSFKYEDDRKYISIDMRSANWSALKRYDPVHVNELGNSYNDLLDQFEFPDIFKYSKYLRQFIFGNIDPKRISKVQRNMIQDVVRKYETDLTLECVRVDEVIFSFSEFEDIGNVLVDESKFRTKIFSVQRIDDFRLDTIYGFDGQVIDKELVNLDGTLFFIKLKEYITREPLDIRDFIFRSNGKLAIWDDPRLEFQLK
jgi:hypothetical protein